MIKIRNCSIEQFAKLLERKICYCFGCGRQAEGFFRKYSSLHMEKQIKGFVDNAQEKNGTSIVINGVEIPIYSFQKFLDIRTQDSIMLTTSMYCHKMIEQMDAESKLNNMECYVDFFIENAYEAQHFTKTHGDAPKIPKVIHYCWFGKKEIPAQFLKYMESWKIHCPEYEIVRWDENNYDVSKSRYMKQAYDAGKWAFVSDYARLDIIYQYGGIYLDTDVEIIKNLNDLLYDEMYCGFEQNNYINFGLGYGAVQGHAVLADLIEQYNNMDFLKEDGQYNQTACAVYQLEEMIKLGFCVSNVYQCMNKIAVYPSEVFAPQNLLGDEMHITENTYSIHHYSSTWWNNEEAISMNELKKNLQMYKTRIGNCETRDARSQT